jgi:hypothetical protein
MTFTEKLIVTLCVLIIALALINIVLLIRGGRRDDQEGG